jgi:hypothetical protein
MSDNTPRPAPPTPADIVLLHRAWGTWPARRSLDDWWHHAYGGVDTPQERS